jgi:hypothetical protein
VLGRSSLEVGISGGYPMLDEGTTGGAAIGR